ncbi:hypothetical protein MGYG_07946 [Nannizzia gypsea CBS 118893]|uniref:Amidoligase enzyme n=1 Tax=Arthroderma gypseum (strain ATCC MYA-4604 / CBS 118893) TaxID=535722 RepID=E4V4M1_ARTGP|nr:hypothetical protein MGYG_07946 [Nannizzia gypsea CBS 118893]EFR04945.1 hypothetical protein MGYG_07946 [Nannizzia gypsea CBS 118893]
MASFGVEMELLVKPKDNLFPMLVEYGYKQNNIQRINRNVVHAVIVKKFLEEEFPMELATEDSQYICNWLVASDSSIKESSGFFGVEVITRILYTNKDWVEEINDFWEILNLHFEILVDPSCGTHIHVRPVEGYTLVQLKSIAKLTTVFQPAITALIPVWRQNADWCRPNAEIVEPMQRAQQQGRRALFDWIDSIPSKDSLWEEVSPNKIVAWNFRNAQENGCGTVEYRQPPPVGSRNETKRWIAISLALFQTGIDPNFVYPVGNPTVENLKMALIGSAEQLGISQWLTFDGASQHSTPIRSLTDAERQYLTTLKSYKPSIFAKNLERRRDF